LAPKAVAADATGKVLATLCSVRSFAQVAVSPGGQCVALRQVEGLRGSARVVSIKPCPRLRKCGGRLVLATVTHRNGYVFDLLLEGSAKPLGATGWHQLYSATRGAWVRVESLRAGEELRTQSGRARIASIRRRPGVHRVYNLEVRTRHCYYVSKLGVLSHNARGCGGSGRTPRKPSRQIRKEWERAHHEAWPKEPGTGHNQDVSHKRRLVMAAPMNWAILSLFRTVSMFRSTKMQEISGDGALGGRGSDRPDRVKG